MHAKAVGVVGVLHQSERAAPLSPVPTNTEQQSNSCEACHLRTLADADGSRASGRVGKEKGDEGCLNQVRTYRTCSLDLDIRYRVFLLSKLLRTEGAWFHSTL